MDATAGFAIGSRRGLGRVRHIDTVFIWVQTFSREHVDAATMHGWIGNEIPVRRKQADPESVILSADRDDCCAERWKLVTDGSGDANSGVVEQEVYVTTR